MCVFLKSGIKILLGIIGPEDIGIDKLRICRLPDEEVGKSEFSAWADYKIGIGLTRRIEIVRYILLGQALGCALPSCALLGKPLAGGQYLISAAVVYRDVYGRSDLVCGTALKLVNKFENIVRKTFALSYILILRPFCAFSCSRSSASRRYSRKRSIMPLTSSGGLRQFSVEKA